MTITNASPVDYGFIKTGSALTVHFTDGASFTWTPDHPSYEAVITALKERAGADDIRALMDFKKKISVATQAYGDFVLNDDGVAYKGKMLNMSLTERIMQMAAEGFDAGPMLRFLEKLLKNPRREAVQSLYDFMEHNKLPIHPDGDFLAYKIVKSNYMDIYSGTFDNSVGKVCEMEPWEVEADRDQTCSAGLHVCSKDYLPHYGSGGSKIMIVKVNPSAVVAVPRDYNNAKMRVWQYTVIGEMDGKESAGILERYGVFSPDAVNETAEKHNFAWGDNLHDDSADIGNEPDDEWETDDERRLARQLRAKYPKVAESTLAAMVSEADTYDSTDITYHGHQFDYQNEYYIQKPDGTFREIDDEAAGAFAGNGVDVFVVYADDVGGDHPVEDVRVLIKAAQD